MYEVIIVTMIFMQFLLTKTHRGIDGIMFFYFPSPRYEGDLCTMETTICIM